MKHNPFKLLSIFAKRLLYFRTLINNGKAANDAQVDHESMISDYLDQMKKPAENEVNGHLSGT